jgi:hypothetical protein
MNVLTELAYGLPVVPQFTITVTVFLTFSVYSLRISGDIPGNSYNLFLFALDLQLN